MRKGGKRITPTAVVHQTAVLARLAKMSAEKLNALTRCPYDPASSSAETAITAYREKLEIIEGEFDELARTCAFLAGAAAAFGIAGIATRLEKISDYLDLFREVVISEIVLCAGMQSICIIGQALEPDPEASLEAARDIKNGSGPLSDESRTKIESLAEGLSLLADTFGALGELDVESRHLRSIATQEQQRCTCLAGLLESVLEPTN